MSRLVFCLLVLCFQTSVFSDRLLAQTDEMMVRVPYNGKSYIGQPLAWDGKEMMLLRRDGKMSMLPVKSSKELEKVSDAFEPYSFDKLNQRLRREFGSKYQVTATENFLVVHPPGNADIWAQPFQDLYWRFEVYFASRGMKIENPEFPMVAVVLRTRAEFDRFLNDYQKYDARMLGYYSVTSNRIITYDQSKGSKGRGKAWGANNSTLIHEATHQTAYNTGVHSRRSAQVRWVCEGLAMMFEAKGVNDSAHYSKQSDRIHYGRLRALQRFYRDRKMQGVMSELLVSDDLFRSDIELAYAYSWGMTFFFSEKMPTEYRQFLQRDGAREDFAKHSGKDRVTEFAGAFGSDIAGIESRMKRFIMSLDANK